MYKRPRRIARNARRFDEESGPSFRFRVLKSKLFYVLRVYVHVCLLVAVRSRLRTAPRP